MMYFYVCNFFYYVLPARMSVPTCRGQKKVPHPPELEFSVCLFMQLSSEVRGIRSSEVEVTGSWELLGMDTQNTT